MRLLNNTPGKHYFLSILVIGAALFATFSSVIYRNYRDAINLNEWALQNYEVTRQIRMVLFDLIAMETGVRGYLLTGQKKFLEPYQNAKKLLPERMKNLRAWPGYEQLITPEMSDELKRIESFKTSLEDQIALQETNLTMLENQKIQMDSLRDSLEMLIQKRLDYIQKQIEHSKKEQRNFLYTLIIGTILAIGGMMLATLIILTLAARSLRAEEELRISAERLITVMSGINDGVFDFNPISKAIYFSPSYKSMLGYSEEEYKNTLENFKASIHPEDFQKTIDMLRAYSERQIPEYKTTFRMHHKDGSWRWIMSRGVGIWDKHGNMIRLIGTNTDVTEQKNREEELVQLNSDLETFTYIASHDLRSPLVNLKGFTGEIKHAVNRINPIIQGIKNTLPPDDQKILSESLDQDIPESLQFIEKSVERMDTLTTAVLDLSRIGKYEYRIEPVDVEKIVKKCLGGLAFEISKNDIEVIVNPLPQVMSDALALEQVFSNLLDNAVKYLEPGRRGSIVISGEVVARDVVFSIQDNGRGIDEADRKKIFEIFRRARNSGNVRGLGMGMAYVKATIRKLGGAIWFDSLVNHGTTFYFRLPKYKTKEKIYDERLP